MIARLNTKLFALGNPNGIEDDHLLDRVQLVSRLILESGHGDGKLPMSSSSSSSLKLNSSDFLLCLDEPLLSKSLGVPLFFGVVGPVRAVCLGLEPSEDFTPTEFFILAIL
jgi:hypothetical protein